MINKVIILFAMYSHLSTTDVEMPYIPDVEVRQEGISSWYGSGIANDHGMHGQITATGEPFRPDKITCASRSIPLNTVVFVTLTRNGNTIACRVNDRGPYGALLDSGEWVLKLSRGDPGEWRGIMDMSRGAAEAIGFDFNRGFEHVQIRYKHKHKKKRVNFIHATQ